MIIRQIIPTDKILQPLEPYNPTYKILVDWFEKSILVDWFEKSLLVEN